MEAPKFPSIFRNVKKAPRRFRYRPKHYSPKAEELEERKKRIEQEVKREGTSEEKSVSGHYFRPSFRNESYRSGASAANLRLVVILMLLMAVTYVVVQWLGKLE